MNAIDPQRQRLPGELANNGINVTFLRTVLNRSENNVNIVPKVFEDVAADEAWREFVLGDNPDHVFRFGPADFRRFIEAPRREGGCETPIHTLQKMLQGTPQWETFLELTRGEPGGVNNPTGTNQYTPNEVNCDNITVDQPMDAPPPKPPPTGTSVSYALRRLSKERRDLYELVRDGKLSAHAAMVQAGFRDKQITLPVDPSKAGRLLARHFTREQFSALVDAALDIYAPKHNP